MAIAGRSGVRCAKKSPVGSHGCSIAKPAKMLSRTKMPRPVAEPAQKSSSTCICNSKVPASFITYNLSDEKDSIDTPIMVADAVIYHPAVSHYLRYVATTGTLVTLASTLTAS